ncbi:uncharacterized protein LOC111643189 [Copidosoma floridanum]|uniref:uncharacterized protein LOC111643189 n=1 Tax=Copidosoma floridanum TaxID=29053 RepID=UPI000C6F7874|nr:uncharacterized protein LOC111643189 [Copidosoma floridanum]
MGDATQELFLVEFLIDRVNIPSVQAIHDDILPVTTCIEFRILNLAPIYVSQDTANEKCTCMGEEPQVFRKGKSCLFALPRRLLDSPICSFPITMSVYKKLPPTVLPDVMSIGCCQIEARDMLNCLLQECPKADPSDDGKPYRTIKNKYRISTPTGQCVGDVGLFLRLSRLGRKVVTQFQNPHNRKPYLFKGSANSPVFQCRRIPSKLTDMPRLQGCSCEKPLQSKSEEKPAKTCCDPGPAKTSGCGPQRRLSSSRKRKSRAGPRPCCPGGESSGNTKLKECPDTPKTRQCGCEAKGAQPFSCSHK